MKTKICSALFASIVSLAGFAQDVTTVNATSAEISDNLDLRAVASIFGESANLEDFERRLNDPKMQISNLDLNNDNQVDYLRVIESVEGNTHLIVLQAVLERDVYQDVATLEVERDSNNNVQVQVVGDVYMYGPNYIYEPVYVSPPVIYTTFWLGSYRPYVSNWYWGYYPGYYHVWHPQPIYRYRRNVNVYVNVHNHYNYVNVRRSDRAVALYNGRRANAYERQYPNRSFQQRHTNVANRYELDKARTFKNDGRLAGTRKSGTRSNAAATNTVRNAGTRANTNTVRNTGVKTQNTIPRGNSGVRSQSSGVKENAGTRVQTSTRDNAAIKTRDLSNEPKGNSGVRSQSATPRENTSIRTRSTSIENTPVRTQTAPQRQSSPVQTRANAPARTQAAPQTQRVQAPAARGNDNGQRQSSQRENGGGRR